MTDLNKNFPEGFLWGTATAAHQVEGQNTKSDWWHWEVGRDDIPNSGIATDHYNLYKKDFDLIKDVLHNNAHRLSIEWARIEPEEGKIDEKSLKHYADVFNELSKRNIKIILTLDHFTHPLWFMEKGGFEKKGNIKYFERFTELVVKEYGDKVDYWCIINEPNIYSTMSYVKGFWTPEKKNLISALKVYVNMAKAHKNAYKIIHSNIPQAVVGSAINMTYFKGYSIVGRLVARIASFIVNESFIWLSKHYDYIGINSYFFKPLKFSDIAGIRGFKRTHILQTLNGGNNDLGWLIYPQGIYHVVKGIWNKYKKPIIITENGTADKKDRLRQKYILDNLSWLLAAIKEGADIRGYFHWTLMDNIEWILGKKARFGLFETNYETMKRTPRKSALLFGYISKNNTIDIPRNLIDK